MVYELTKVIFCTFVYDASAFDYKNITKKVYCEDFWSLYH